MAKTLGKTMFGIGAIGILFMGACDWAEHPGYMAIMIAVMIGLLLGGNAIIKNA